MRRAQPYRRNGGNAGFTLIELLVAFTILAILTIAIQRGVSTAIGGIARADTRIGAEHVVRTLMSGPLGAGPDASQPRRGRMNGYDWSVRFEPVDLPFSARRGAPAIEGQWIPLRMVVAVSPAGASGVPLTVETVRLMRIDMP